MNLRHSSLILSLVVVSLSISFLALGARPGYADEPEITFQFPEDGDVLKQPPLALQMCFKEPVDVRDLPPLDEGDFEFSVTRPDSVHLGLRIIFQPDGYGVVIQPGPADPESPDGEWTWEYRVVDRATGDPLEGAVTFAVNAETGGEILPAIPTPPPCLAQGATQVPTAPPEGTEETPTATPDAGSSPGDDDGDLSVLELALITIGIAAAAAVVGVLAFFFRKRVGYEPHAPTDDAGDDHQ